MLGSEGSGIGSAGSGNFGKVPLNFPTEGSLGRWGSFGICMEGIDGRGIGSAGSGILGRVPLNFPREGSFGIFGILGR